MRPSVEPAAAAPRAEGSAPGAARAQAEALVVFGRDAVSLWDAAGHVRGSAGLAALCESTASTRAGREDPLQRYGALQPGERVLDATLGFGQDARVAARLVGPSGRGGGPRVEPAAGRPRAGDAGPGATGRRARASRCSTGRRAEFLAGCATGSVRRGALRPDVRPGAGLAARIRAAPPPRESRAADAADARRRPPRRPPPRPGQERPLHAGAQEPSGSVPSAPPAAPRSSGRGSRLGGA